MWRARRAGLTTDDLVNMTPDELDLWLELEDWVSDAPNDEESAVQSADDAERAFFHM